MQDVSLTILVLFISGMGICCICVASEFCCNFDIREINNNNNNTTTSSLHDRSSHIEI